MLYFLDWADGHRAFRSQLWRYDLGRRAGRLASICRLFTFRIGDREVLDLAYEDGQLLVSFDASGYADQNLRVQRGILRIEWDGRLRRAARRSSSTCPTRARRPSRGLAAMELDGVGYLWATVGNDHIYCADARTGRGLFFFDRPTSHDDSQSCWGLCFGQDALWVSENVPGPDRVHRVNVTRNLDAPFEGPRVLRRLIMTIQTEPEDGLRQMPGRCTTTTRDPTATSNCTTRASGRRRKPSGDHLGAPPMRPFGRFTYDPGRRRCQSPDHAVRGVCQRAGPQLLVPVRDRSVDEPLQEIRLSPPRRSGLRTRWREPTTWPTIRSSTT